MLFPCSILLFHILLANIAYWPCEAGDICQATLLLSQHTGGQRDKVTPATSLLKKYSEPQQLYMSSVLFIFGICPILDIKILN